MLDFWLQIDKENRDVILTVLFHRYFVEDRNNKITITGLSAALRNKESISNLLIRVLGINSHF